jgi:hypothetical protein
MSNDPRKPEHEQPPPRETPPSRPTRDTEKIHETEYPSPTIEPDKPWPNPFKDESSDKG